VVDLLGGVEHRAVADPDGVGVLVLDDGAVHERPEVLEDGVLEVGAGDRLRRSATGAMLWRDVDLANGRFEVGRDKTDAGMREVDMLPLLREILTEHKAASKRAGPDDPVFVTSAGKPRSRHNIRQDVVDAVVAHANRLVEERGLQPLPLGITPHKLRHTFASILVAIGKDPTYVMQQLGHTDPAFTLRVYAHVMRRSGDERERLRALVEGHVWAVNGQYAPESAPQTESRSDS
jgi:integrase